MTPPAFLTAVSGTNVLFANEEEALILSDEADVGEAMSRLSAKFEEVVITRGEHGARAHCANVDYDVSSPSNIVVDTTGAGDAATGAYLGARLNGAEPREALTLAMAASALVVAGLGATG
jgi:sugar/nucleoside kinase (ribokinase family)